MLQTSQDGLILQEWFVKEANLQQTIPTVPAGLVWVSIAQISNIQHACHVQIVEVEQCLQRILSLSQVTNQTQPVTEFLFLDKHK